MKNKLFATIFLIIGNYCFSQNNNINNALITFISYCDKLTVMDFYKIDKEEFINKIQLQRILIGLYVPDSVVRKHLLAENFEGNKIFSITKFNTDNSSKFEYRLLLKNDTIIDYSFIYPYPEKKEGITELDVEMFTHLAKFSPNFYELMKIGNDFFKEGDTLPENYTKFFDRFRVAENNKEFLMKAFYGYDESLFNYDLSCSNDSILRYRFYTQNYRDSIYYETAEIYIDVRNKTRIIEKVISEKEWGDE